MNELNKITDTILNVIKRGDDDSEYLSFMLEKRGYNCKNQVLRELEFKGYQASVIKKVEDLDNKILSFDFETGEYSLPDADDLISVYNVFNVLK